MNVFYINGEFVNADDAVLPATDLSILRGYGAFDYLRTYGGQPFRLRSNIERLRRSAALIGLEYDWSDDEIYDIVMETLSRNTHEDSNIRLVVTGGSSPDNITPSGEPRLMVMITPVKPLPEAWYTQGIKVVTYAMERYIPGAKSTNYIPAILAQKYAREHNATEALYMDRYGNVTEGTTTNVFAFYGDTLVTPAIDLLPGITRDVVLELTQPVYHVEIRNLPLRELLAADEVMITASNKRIVPVVQVNDTTIGDGQVGPRVQNVMQLYDAETYKAAQHA